ncbi:MAG: hypothetical protein V2J55_15110 [Candidatus Competibacteraceae bacterium]|jgi:hypothetical protein|nr:hypothetical protein [Candidatus Competibacteraceae bacterium]
MPKVTLIRADKKLRRQVLWGFLVVGALLLWLVYSLNIHAWTLLNSPDPRDQQRLLSLIRWIFYTMPVFVFGFVGWLLWLARRILETNQYPLPGQRVIRPTLLRTGTQARRMGFGLIAISIALLVLEMLLTYYAMQILQLVEPLPTPNNVSHFIRLSNPPAV